MADSPPQPAAVSLAPFKRANARLARLYGPRLVAPFELHAMAQLGYGLDPRSVPVQALRLMGATCPGLYLADQTVAGIVRRSGLFSVRGDPKICAEVEAWLWREDLLPRLLAAATRGFSYGAVACVLDWERKTLRFEVPKNGDTESGETRTKTKVDHTHYRKAFEVHPDSTTFELDDQGEIAFVDVLGSRYDISRSVAWIWDPEFGEVWGQGARQRAWIPYCTYLVVRLLRDKYLERSVDSPRIAWTPDGHVTVDGVEKEIPNHVVDLLLELQGSGAIALPSARYQGSSDKKYDLTSLDLPERSEVWAAAIDRCEAEVFKAHLVPPAVAGALDDASGAGGKAMDGMLREFIEDLANFCASGLTRLVQIVHAKNYDPDKVDAPHVVATDVGKAAAQKKYLEVLRLANAAARGEISARADLPRLLDLLGIPIRDAPFDPFEEPDPSAGDPGRDPQHISDRQDRRDDSTTTDGEDDTGGDNVDRPNEQPA